MPPLQQLQWKEPPASRAKPIPPERWEQYREGLCWLYQKMKLDDLMDVMRARHSFAPSRRQYISQFEKWGIRKYKRTVTEVSPPGGLPSLSLRPDTITGQENYEKSPFRISSIQMHPSVSQHSLTEKPEVPPKKRQKHSGFMAAKDPYSDLGLAFDIPSPSRSVAQSLMPFRQETIPLGAIPSGCVDTSPKLLNHSPGLSRKEGSPSVSIEAGSMHTFLSSIQPSNDWNLEDSERWVTNTSAFDNLAKGKERLDCSQSDLAASQVEIQDMKCAAGFLSSLSFDEDAFVLYLLVLGGLKDSPGQPPQLIYSALLASVRSAETLSQVEVSRTLLEQKLASQDGSISAVENFLLQMLLASTYVRISDYEMAKFHTQLALEFGSWKSMSADDESVKWVKVLRYIAACQTEELTGIPASELLKTLCSMISMNSPQPSYNPLWDLLFRLRIGLETLSNQSDGELARQFLDAYSRRNTLIPNSSEQGAYREGVRTFAKGLIEKSLKIKLSDVQDSGHISRTKKPSDIPQRLEIPDTPMQPTVSGQSFDPVAAALLPTLAPSLHSPDFSSLRMLRIASGKIFGTAMQTTSDTLPSSLFRRNDLSFQTMSELSQRMASSLSLASLTALDALAFASINVMDRMAGWENRQRSKSRMSSGRR